MSGYDTLFFQGDDDAQMISIAGDEGRVILTRDTQIMRRRVVTGGRIRAILIRSDDSERQMLQVIDTLHLSPFFNPFTICLECNRPLTERSKSQVEGRVPPYVFQTRDQYMECPDCHRLYWRGTHWQAMTERLNKFSRHSRERL
jgi:hypothetical protein